MWIRPLRTIGQEGIRTARRNYLRYCTKNGPPNYPKNIDIHNEIGGEPTEDEIAIQESLEEEPTWEPPRKKTKTSDIIREKIIEGEKPLELYKQFPGCIPMIKNLLPLHVNRYEKTVCSYIYRGTGVGKTTNLKRVLNFYEQHHDINHYYKISGLSKFFNGYNFEDIVVIDDPIEPDITQREEVQMFKSIINEHKRHIEIKGSSMPWDTRLVIITANVSAHELANACGITCKEAVYRKLSHPFKPRSVLPGEQNKYCMYLIKLIAKVCCLEIDAKIM